MKVSERLSERSRKNLDMVYPTWIEILNKAAELTDFEVICGHRGEKEQNQAYDDGKSKLKYPLSAHNVIPSMAVDLAPRPIDWSNKEAFCHLAGIVLGIAHQMGVTVKWGGDWKSFKDYPHYEIVL